MDPPSVPQASDDAAAPVQPAKSRTESFSQMSDNSQTAADFIRDQMQLEADAREALPYSIDSCTKPLGPLRQSVFGCLTCNPPPANTSDPYDSPAGLCYSCSIQCHGDHNLVEIFNKRNFTCDCGTTRYPEASPCILRIDPATNTKGAVHSEAADDNNKYNHNFRNRFCGCECDYDPFQQKGTMFQCLGLGTHETGGCGEDWWHPGCLVGLGPKWFETTASGDSAAADKAKTAESGPLPTISEDASAPVPADDGNQEPAEDEDPPPPPGFPDDDEFEGFLCYKCLDAFPWIKRYAGTPGFLAPVYLKDAKSDEQPTVPTSQGEDTSRKRKAEEDDGDADSQGIKRQKSEAESPPPNGVKAEQSGSENATVCKLAALPPAPKGTFSLFFKEGFRENICHCPSCFPLVLPHPQLLEEEELYEPPVSDQGSENGASTHGSGSLLDRGESALRNVDRVRAIEGVMAYNHLKDKLKPFFQQFAESGQAISAEDIKGYFAKLRGDEQDIQDAGEGAKTDSRKEQSGY